MNQFAPFKPPFAYDPIEGGVEDSFGDLVLGLYGYTPLMNNQIGTLIADIMNQHAEEMEKEPKK